MDNSKKEKRRHQRTLVEEILRSAVIRPVGEETEIWGMIIDRSIQGVQLSVPIEMLPKMNVEITIPHRDKDKSWRNKSHKGRVCYCNPGEIAGESYHIGVEFLDL